MIIYQDTKAVFLDDISNNYFAARIEDAFLKKTGSLPSDSRGWANDYARFSTVLSSAQVADDITIAIEYHCSPVGRTRIDVLLAGGDDNAVAAGGEGESAGAADAAACSGNKCGAVCHELS